jgi:hypothetical protein
MELTQDHVQWGLWLWWRWTFRFCYHGTGKNKVIVKTFRTYFINELAHKINLKRNVFYSPQQHYTDSRSNDNTRISVSKYFDKSSLRLDFFPWRWGGSSTQAWMPTYVSILRIHQVIWVWRATVEWYWQGKTEELGEKPVPVPLCPP